MIACEVFLLPSQRPALYRVTERFSKLREEEWGGVVKGRCISSYSLPSSLVRSTGILPVVHMCVYGFVWLWPMFCFPAFYLNRSLEAFKLHFSGEWSPPFYHTCICHTNHQQDGIFCFLNLLPPPPPHLLHAFSFLNFFQSSLLLCVFIHPFLPFLTCLFCVLSTQNNPATTLEATAQVLIMHCC